MAELERLESLRMQHYELAPGRDYETEEPPPPLCDCCLAACPGNDEPVEEPASVVYLNRGLRLCWFCYTHGHRVEEVPATPSDFDKAQRNIALKCLLLVALPSLVVLLLWAML